MKKINIFFLFFVFLFGCAHTPKSDIQMYVKQGVDWPQYKRVAVVGFEDDPSTRGSGNEIADLIGFELLKRGYSVVERSKVGLILKEQSMGLSDIIDPATAAEVGNILGVRALVIGTVTKYTVTKSRKGQSSLYIPTVGGFELPEKETYTIEVSFTVKMVDVETAVTLWQGANSKSGKGKIVLPFAQEAVKEIMRDIPVP